MTKYTIDINGKRYKLSESFKKSVQKRAENVYDRNEMFSCWWSVAKKKNYTDESWEDNPHQEGDPILTIETKGVMVPWDSLDQLEAEMIDPDEAFSAPHDDDNDDAEILDSGNGMASVPPDGEQNREDIFGRTHFSITPKRFDKVPEPDSNEPDKIPAKPEEVSEDPEMVMRVPRHPDIDETWSAGEAVTKIASRVEWNVQNKADQPRIERDKSNSHDAFESLCKTYDCEMVSKYAVEDGTPSDTAGQVDRKGESAYKEGRFGGDNWSV
jgi:hypothetical protein